MRKDKEFKTNLVELQTAYKKLRKAYHRKTKSTHTAEFGEGIIIKEIVGKKNFLSAEDYHPKKLSNTYRLYEKSRMA